MARIAEDSLLLEILPEGEPVHCDRLVHFASYPECGAVATFLGVVRATENGQAIAGLRYEYHPEMALSEMQKIASRAAEQFEIARIACVHRSGHVPVQQASIAIVIGADHRESALQACKFMIDEIKKTVPIWKSIIGSTVRAESF